MNPFRAISAIDFMIDWTRTNDISFLHLRKLKKCAMDIPWRSVVGYWLSECLSREVIGYRLLVRSERDLKLKEGIEIGYPYFL